MIVIGLTGSFGTGKTFVASIFKSLGAQIIDADRIAHRVIRRPSPAYKGIVGLFSKDILGPDGEIVRSKLGRKAFADKRLLRRLEGIVHPQVIKEIKRSIRAAGAKDAVVIDAPLLIEAKLDKLVDKLVVVKCSKRRQLKRCVKKFQLQKEEISLRIKRQMSLKKKMQIADYVIENSGTKSRTKKQVRKLWEEISCL